MDIVVCFVLQIVMNKTVVREITCSNFSCFLNYNNIAIKKIYTSVTLKHEASQHIIRDASSGHVPKRHISDVHQMAIYFGSISDVLRDVSLIPSSLIGNTLERVRYRGALFSSKSLM